MFFSNFLNLILTKNTIFLGCTIVPFCFSLLLNYHSDVQSLKYGCIQSVQVCTITNDTTSVTKIYIINFIENLQSLAATTYLTKELWGCTMLVFVLKWFTWFKYMNRSYLGIVHLLYGNVLKFFQISSWF